jgi:hypothetical protein
MDGDQLLLSIKGSFKNGAIANNRLVHSINGLNLSQSFNAVGCTVLSDEEKPASRAASMATGSRKAGWSGPGDADPFYVLPRIHKLLRDACQSNFSQL